MTDKTYFIHEDNMDRLEKKLRRIQSKCEKHNCHFEYERLGEEYRKVTTSDGCKVTAKFIEVKVSGIAAINGWQFVAILESTPGGNVIKQYAEDIEVPDYYKTCKLTCDHCKSKRARKSTCIIRNIETGEFQQVGKYCLLTYTHGFDAEGITSYIAMFDELIEGYAPDTTSNIRYYETLDVLKVAYELVSKLGYTPVDAGDISTKILTLKFLESMRDNKVFSPITDEIKRIGEDIDFNCNRSEVIETATDILSWLVNEADTSNIYMHNLKTIASNLYVKWSDVGILASGIVSYNKAMNFKKRTQEFKASHEADFKSEYVGNIGDRITTPIKSLICVHSSDTIYGMLYMYKMVDNNDNILIWSTSKCLKDEKFSFVTGTIKSHDTYRDIKQTYLTRCKLVAESAE